MQDFFTLIEVSEKLRVSKMTVYRYIKSWKLNAYKFWKELRIKPEDYKKFVDKSKFISSPKK
jgi:excisionase family DNA binding protein